MEAIKPRLFPSEEEIGRLVEEGRKSIERIRSLGPEDNSALVWFPPILRAGLPVPKTIFVGFDPEQLWPTLDGQQVLDSFPMQKMIDACQQIGYPVFLRTDLSSAKHDGPEAYRINCTDDLMRCICLTFEDNAIKDIAPFVRAFMLRKWLDLPAAFSAFGGHPISVEWRIFASQDAVRCEHFYWPEEAFEGREWDRWLPKNWRGALKSISSSPRDIGDLRDIAIQAVREIGHGEWSVDFARDRRGKWWLTDMATAESSWHPEHDW